jgi:RND family efflux transporter MFP subunit
MLSSTRLTLLAAGLLAATMPASSAPAQTNGYKVSEVEIDDLKQVLATVRSKDRLEARVRTPGTVVALNVEAGVEVKPGQVVATVVDPKIALRMKGLDAQIVGLESRLATARLDYQRAQELQQRGVTPQARVDQLKTALDVATNELAAARAERQVIEEQASEGQVLAPAAGRVLRVPVTEGSVVMAGESVATIAANEYLVRLELPERHARFMKVGDVVNVATRDPSSSRDAATRGRIVQVYPELQGGRVVADADVPGLGDYFVGERALVWISAGKRRTMVVPARFVATRFGLDYVRVVPAKGDATDVVVQVGAEVPLAGGEVGREILAGLKAGDLLAAPGNKP